jgi:hypothetical protein
MFRFLLEFLRPNKENTLFNKEYRSGYNKLWINSIRNYRP